MPATEVDFAIIGSDPLAQLLAGLLAGPHRRRVVLVPGERAGFGLTHGFDISAAAITRPHSWAILKRTVTETARVLAKAGAARSVTRIGPIFFAETSSGKQALAHMRQVAAGFDQHPERLADGALGPNREAVQLPDALMFDRASGQQALGKWLEKLKVPVLAGTAKVEATAGGGFRCTGDDQNIAALRAIVVGADAVLGHPEVHANQPLLTRRRSTTVLTERASPLLAPYLHAIDTGVVLTQGRSKAIAALAAGEPDTALPRIGQLLSHQTHLRLAGRAGFDTISSTDGASIFGALRPGEPELILGADFTTLFLAPALARWLDNAASDEDIRYFTTHGPRDPAFSDVAEYAGAASW